MFVFWELVGLCSYLLIGYWYDRPAAARAAVKAFWITKLGDLGFVAGIVMLWSATGTFDFLDAVLDGHDGTLPVELLPCIMFLIYLGPVGKSAQFPLHIWLPDAMEGPDAGVRAHPRRHDGDRRRLPREPRLPALPADARRAACSWPGSAPSPRCWPPAWRAWTTTSSACWPTPPSRSSA
jgi:hypothetical protein